MDLVRLCSIVVLYVVFMGFSCGMLLLFTWMDESLVADQQVATREGLCTDFTNERLLFRVGADVSLEMFLWTAIASQSVAGRVESNTTMGARQTYQAGKESLAMRTG